MAKYFGTKGNDYITGAAETDYFYDFGVGRDVLTGGFKSDVFYLTVDDITDTVDGRDGNDTIDYSGADRALRIDLGSRYGDGDVPLPRHHFRTTPPALSRRCRTSRTRPVRSMATPSTGTAAATRSTAMPATITSMASTVDDTLLGGAGADHLYGGDQDDTLIGGAGNDFISGGNGIDTVSYADGDRGSGILANLTDGPLSLDTVPGHPAHTVSDLAERDDRQRPIRWSASRT